MIHEVYPSALRPTKMTIKPNLIYYSFLNFGAKKEMHRLVPFGLLMTPRGYCKIPQKINRIFAAHWLQYVCHWYCHMNQHNELHCQVSRFPPVDIWQRGNGVILTAISKGSKRKIVYLQQVNEVLASIVPQKMWASKKYHFQWYSI